MNIKMLTTGSIVIALILLLVLNIFSNTVFNSARLDLTDNNLYTLSQGSKNIVSNLEEPVHLRFFLSHKLATRLPGINSYTIRVKELIQEFKRHAGSNLSLSIVDPEPFTEQEEQAVGYGLQGVPLNDNENTFYFGLVATGPTDKEEVIPFFSPQKEEFVEYDIAKLIYQASNPKQKVIGLITSLKLDGDTSGHMPGMPGMPQSPQSQPWVIMKQIRQLFAVEHLDPDIDSIPENIDVLMLAHPKDLAIETQYAIDQFILAGGRAIIFVDPHAETDTANARQMGMPGTVMGSSDLAKLFNSWGINLAQGKVAADLQLAQKVSFNMGNRASAVDYPVWMKLSKDQLNNEDIITSDVGTINLASSGYFTITEKEGLSVTPIIQTTDKASDVDKAQLGFMQDPNQLLRNIRPGDKPLVLAARITGKATTAFPDGVPSGEEDSEKNTPHGTHGEANKEEEKAESSPAKTDENQIMESKDDINVVVFADTDLLDDRFWVRVQNLLGSQIAVPIAANANLVINALDNLMGSNDLISVRNRGQYSRPFTKVEEIRQEAEARFREKEQELMTKLRTTERKLLEMQRGKNDSNSMIISQEQRLELERFRDQRLAIRKELRQVRHELRKNIESLEGWTKFINIGLIPILIALGGLAVAIMRVRNREAAVAKSTALS